MINRENELPSYPLVEMALKAIADWVSNYRNAIGFKNEFSMCGPDEVMRMAKDIGVTPSRLQELVRKGPDSAKLLKSMLIALHVDPKIIAGMDPLVMRELNWLCITCSNRSDASMNLPREQPPSIFVNFAPMPCRSMSCSIRKVNCPHIKERGARRIKHVRFGSKADIEATQTDVCFVPIADIV